MTFNGVLSVRLGTVDVLVAWAAVCMLCSMELDGVCCVPKLLPDAEGWGALMPTAAYRQWGWMLHVCGLADVA